MSKSQKGIRCTKCHGSLAQRRLVSPNMEDESKLCQKCLIKVVRARHECSTELLHEDERAADDKFNQATSTMKEACEEELVDYEQGRKYLDEKWKLLNEDEKEELASRDVEGMRVLVQALVRARKLTPAVWRCSVCGTNAVVYGVLTDIALHSCETCRPKIERLGMVQWYWGIPRTVAVNGTERWNMFRKMMSLVFQKRGAEVSEMWNRLDETGKAIFCMDDMISENYARNLIATYQPPARMVPPLNPNQLYGAPGRLVCFPMLGRKDSIRRVLLTAERTQSDLNGA